MSGKEFIDSQKIIYELKPTSHRYISELPLGAKEARQLNDVELKKVNGIPFIRLLGGKEPLNNVRIRYELYQKNWKRQMDAINAVLLKTDRFKFRNLRKFLESEVHATNDARLTTALLNLGSNISNHDRLLNNVCRYLREDSKVCLVKINPNVDFNIQRIIKRIEDTIAYKLHESSRKRSKNSKGANKRKIVDIELEDQKEEEDDKIEYTEIKDDDDTNSESETEFAEIDEEKLINDFDLIPRKSARSKFEDIEDLLEVCHNRGIKLMVLIQNADAMSSIIMAQTLSILCRFKTITDTTCVIGISTPFIIFQEKISKVMLGKLRTHSFAVDNSNEAINQIMEDLLLNINETYNSLIFEPKLILKFLNRRDVMSIQQFTNYMKMIYMRHYYSQPLSVFWTNDFSKIDLKKIYFEIFKTLPSVIENSGELDRKYLLGIAENNVEVIGNLLRKHLNKLINWRYNFRNIIDFLNFAQASMLETKIWNNNLELFQLLFEKYYELRDSEDNWNQYGDYEELLEDENEGLTNNESPQKSGRRKKRENRLNAKISPSVLLAFLNPLWESIEKEGNEGKVSSFHEQLCNDHQFDFIKRHKAFPTKLSFKVGEVKRLVEGVKSALRDHVCELDLDYQSFREICVVKDDMIEKIHDAFEPTIRENCLRNLDDCGEILFNASHWDMRDEGMNEDQLQMKRLDVEMFHIVEPILCEMYRIFKETGVSSNIYDFYQVFKNSIIRRKEMISIMKEKLAKYEGKFDDEEYEKMLRVIDTLEVEAELGVDEEWDKVTLAWFLKSLSEFQMLGLLREGNSKSQTIEKVIWRGI